MIEIPRQLRNMKLILCHKWDDFAKNKKDGTFKLDKEGKKIPIGKSPIEQNWQEVANYLYHEIKFEEHIKLGLNYGVLCGEKNNGLVVIDCDRQEVLDYVEKNLPKTFKVSSGEEGSAHFYFFVSGLKKKIVMNREGTHYGEVQFTGSYVVGPNSIHPSGNKYEIKNDEDIATITEEELRSVVEKFTDEYENKRREAATEFSSYPALNTFGIKITDVIDPSGFRKIGNSEYQGSNPWHGSTNGNNCCVNTAKDVAYCFRCQTGIGPIKALALNEGIIQNCSDKLSKEQLKETIKKMKEKFGDRIAESDESQAESIEIPEVGSFNTLNPLTLRENDLILEQTIRGESPRYSIWEFKFGQGQYECFLIAGPQFKPDTGDYNEFIKPFDSEHLIEYFDANGWPNNKFFKKVAAKRGIGGTMAEIKSSIIDEQDIMPYFYCVSPPLTQESNEFLKSLSSEQINKIIDYYFEEKNDLDERILTTARMNLLKYLHTIRAIKPQQFLMPHSPHGLYQTITKTGKTAVFGKAGKRRDRISVAGVLGFSTADETNRGDLDKVNESYTIDEVQEDKRTNITQQIITLMEVGETVVSVGRKMVRTESCATINYCTNPKEMQDGNENLKTVNTASFANMLNVISDNYKAMGSRIGVVIFGNQISKIKGERLSHNEFTKVRAIVQHIRDVAAESFTNIMLNSKTHEWMNIELPAEYIQKVEKTSDKIASKEVREFWEGHIEAHRHVRGGAVRLACLDSISELINNNYRIEKILELAEVHLKTLLKYNLESLDNMQTISDDFREGMNNRVLERCYPEYLKSLVLVLLKHFELKPETIENYVTISELESTFKLIADKLKSAKYSRWNELRHKFILPNTGVNSALTNNFGISIMTHSPMAVFKITDVDKFKQFLHTPYYLKLIHDKEPVVTTPAKDVSGNLTLSGYNFDSREEVS
jgi:hypothetical protein